MRNRRDFTYDAELELKDAGAVTASGAARVDGAARVVNLGSARMDGRVILDVSALDKTDGNETYLIAVQFSATSNFTATVAGPQLPVTATGRFELPFSNEVDGVSYPYMRLYTTVAGTTPSVNFIAYAVRS